MALLIIVCAIVFADALTPAWFHSRSLLLLVPVAAALTSSVLITTLTVAGAMGAFAYLGWSRPGAAFTSGYVILLVGCLVAALFVAAVREQQRRRLVVSDQVARAVQRAVLRPLPSMVADLRVAEAYLPAAEGALIGGDWYDVQPSRYGVRVVIGDVSGKGLDAIDASAALLGTFRDAGYHEASLQEVARRLEVCMQRHNVWARTVEGREYDGFATALLLNFSDGHMDVIDFGHVPALVVNVRDGAPTEVEFDSALPLGLGELAVGPPAVKRLPFRVGDLLVLVTDGVTESRDVVGDFYPLIDRLRAMAVDGPGPDRLCDALIADVSRYRRRGPADDAAIMVIQREAAVMIEQDSDARRLYEAPPMDW
ncbi:PP2C family protein-serine/threonine phosphatase [Catenulispora acidiphila]|uniref:PP2C family protein-serine/threonine phosphatase n=1 Tax=Catenulispora acidiphila TaxID=304895 RepID=UPI000675FCF1|nr:PP2C family protein-serine/threonine phosphatase [Catenulispora acidiphila]